MSEGFLSRFLRRAANRSDGDGGLFPAWFRPDPASLFFLENRIKILKPFSFFDTETQKSICETTQSMLGFECVPLCHDSAMDELIGWVWLDGSQQLVRCPLDSATKLEIIAVFDSIWDALRYILARSEEFFTDDQLQQSSDR